MRLVVSVESRTRNIWQIDTAFGRIMVPADQNVQFVRFGVLTKRSDSSIDSYSPRSGLGAERSNLIPRSRPLIIAKAS